MRTRARLESTFNADSIELESVDASGNRQQFYFLAEAPGALIGRQSTPEGLREESRMQGEWLETPFGYRVEGRIPRRLLDVYLGSERHQRLGVARVAACAVRRSTAGNRGG